MPIRQLIQNAITASLMGLIILLGLIAARTVPARHTTPASQSPAQSVSIPVAQGTSVVYDAAKAVAEAQAFAGQSNNADGCYINADPVTGANPLCNDATRPSFDGAHFIACVLKAGGLTPPATFEPLLCNQVNRYVSMPYLVTMLNALPVDHPTQRTARPGDIFIVRENGSPCWGGVVVATGITNSSGLLVATHSSNSGLTDPANSPFCHTNNQGTPIPVTQEYLHIVTDTTPPTVIFTAPSSGNLPFGVPQHLVWQGDDGSDGSGIAGYTLTESIAGAPPTDLAGALPATQNTFDVQISAPCRQITFAITATDKAGNASLAATLVLTASLQGDFDANGMIDQADLARLEAAWSIATGQPGYESTLDINADGRIDAADTLWLRRHTGDHCW